MVLVEGDRAYLRSTAALRVAMKLCRGWPLLGLFLLVPRPIRDLVYRWVARHRYDWFGRREACYSPEGDVSERFLDAG
jgi:predicted DCC family thiol-disulfide oxidoreductase YuxK